MNKEETLTSVKKMLATGQLTVEDLKALFPDAIEEQKEANSLEQGNHKKKISASDILYYMGGVILFASIATMLGQSWDSLGSFGRIFISLGLGLLFWALGAWLLKNAKKDLDKGGLADAVLLTGSLASSSGVFITLTEISGKNFSTNTELIGTLGLIILASMHYTLDWALKRTVLIVFAILLSVGAYIALVSLLFGSLISSSDFWGVVSIISGFMFIGLGSFFGKSDRIQIKNTFWSLGGFVVIASAYGLSQGSDLGPFWEILFPFVLYMAFMSSIKFKSKNFLFTGAFFLFVFVMTIAFKYFGDGLGLPIALLISGLGILASAILVSNIKKKYFV